MAHKIGIIGYGGMGSCHHAHIKLDGIEFVAAHDIVPKRLEIAKERGLKVYDKLEDFLADDSFDIVLIASPNNFHKLHSIESSKAGKHVICEKPVAMNVEEFDEMYEAAKRAGKLFTVHQNRRWDRDFNIVKKSLADGLVGKPFTIESRVMGKNGVIHGWRNYKVAGGGMVYDWGVHLIDQMLWMIDDSVSEVYANLQKIKSLEVDDYFKSVIRFDSGLSAQIEVGLYSLETLPRWYVCGDGGGLIIENWECNGKITHAKQMDIEWEPEIVHTAAGPTRAMAPRPKETLEELPLPEVRTDYSDYYRNVLDVLDNGAELVVKPEESRKVLQILMAIFESDRTGKSVKIDRYYK